MIPFTSNAEPLTIGAAIPDVAGSDSEGKEVKLAAVGAKGYALFFFYPKANTGG